ncbi:Small-conductance mechanosensitive channel [Pseudomonas taetrolens]|uniref:Mechanosensitive ion channel protein n=1 Tax=Pseudomonas taetrolens TaxID=47884 RepID=A0A0J6H000_PSETA|nr:mechanosensitive ion channel domain-containing protein [Pseudomonas taetrolens]KMM87125.1 mechanosensitive ion channel protein [Pseudomonas taetrolens]SEB56002.1 Small-conductance mechanosensitive channel [Pseudomonas taetrolens]SQF84835.1 mechanosensitive ion channel protein MscS [Pseudomonas taetrolens]VEH46581.1 mechanosensitive ion channel protein MscS [Pseudomonas taetrolens]
MFKFKTAILLIILLLTGNGILQAAPTLASVIKAEEVDGKPPVLVNGGLLGALGAGMDEVQGRLGLSMHLLDGWRLRAARAGEEAEVLAEQAYEHPSWNAAADFLIVSVTWFAAFIGLMLLARLVLNYVCSRRVTQNKVRVKSLLGYALPYLFPAMIALPLTLSVSRFLQDSMGVSLALSLAYASSGGVFCAALVLTMNAMFDVGHKRRAVDIIRRTAPRSLFVIGFSAALSDALNSLKIAWQIGVNLASCLSVVAGLIACIAFAHLVVRLRRPVAHLIRNRALAQRLGQPALQESLRIFSVLWYWPILLMLLVSAFNLLGVGESSERTLRNALMTSGLLIGTVFLSTTLHHWFRTAPRSSGAYKVRLLNVMYAVLRIVLAVTFIELLVQIWGFSLLAFASDSSTGKVISDSLGHILLILLVTWLAWVVLDTAIQQALQPTVNRRGSREPSTRTKTILPLLRNAIKVILVVVCTITTMANLGVNVAPFLAGAGVIGLAIGFGSQQLVQDVITGLFIIIEDTISVGDWVVVDSNHSGTVEGLTIRTLRLRDSRGFVHSVPFGQIKVVINHSRQFAYAFFSVQFTYDSDMDKATEVIREAGQQISDDPLLSLSLQGSLTIFGVDSMSLDGVVITAQFRTVSGAQNTISRAFNARLKKLVDKSADVHFAQHYPQGFLMPVRETEGRAESATVKQQPAVLLTDIPPQSQ